MKKKRETPKQPKQPKKAYSSPKVSDFGTVEQITLRGMSGGDAAQMS
jgi:hypothetical protein